MCMNWKITTVQPWDWNKSKITKMLQINVLIIRKINFPKAKKLSELSTHREWNVDVKAEAAVNPVWCGAAQPTVSGS